MWYGEMWVHLYDLLDVLAAKSTATTAAAKKNKIISREVIVGFAVGRSHPYRSSAPLTSSR